VPPANPPSASTSTHDVRAQFRRTHWAGPQGGDARRQQHQARDQHLQLALASAAAAAGPPRAVSRPTPHPPSLFLAAMPAVTIQPRRSSASLTGESFLPLRVVLYQPSTYIYRIT